MDGCQLARLEGRLDHWLTRRNTTVKPSVFQLAGYTCVNFEESKLLFSPWLQSFRVCCHMLPPRYGSQERFFGLRTWAKQTRTIYKQEDHRDTIKSRYLLGVNPTFIRPHPFLIGQYHSTEASVSLSLSLSI